MLHTFCLAFVFLGAQGLLNELGPTSAHARSFIAAVALFVLVVEGAINAKSFLQKDLWLSLSCVVLIPIAEGWASQVMLLASGVIVLSGIFNRPFGVALFLVALLKLISIKFAPGGEVAIWLSGLLWGKWLIPGALNLSSVGPTASGFFSLLFAAILVVIRPEMRIPRKILLLLLLFCAVGISSHIGVWVENTIGPHAGHGHELGEFAHLKWFAVGLFVWHLFSLTTIRRGDKTTQPDPFPPQWKAVTVALLLLFALFPEVSNSRENRRMLVFDHAEMDWSYPTIDDFGIYSGGMFGLLPEYLEIAGWSTETVREDGISEEGLDGVAILTIINCPKIWEPKEKKVISEFVKSGGGLLILGDHTNVFGLQDGFNSLLLDWGIGFNFDSAHYVENGWERSLDWVSGVLPNPAQETDAGTGIGASLSCVFPAFPVLQAPYGFSDDGIATNTVGAFLGNYVLEDGERLGDINLIAARHLGRGSILVFGDTSAFQNSALPHTLLPIVLPAINWIGRGASIQGSVLATSKTISLCLMAALAVFILINPLHRSFASQAYIVIPAIIFSQVIGSMFSEKIGIRELDLQNTVVIDETGPVDVGHYGVGWNAISPLVQSLVRAGHLVLRSTAWDSASMQRAKAVVLVAPLVSLESRKLAVYQQIIKQGGNLVLVGSGESAPFLNEILNGRCTIKPGHLGPVPNAGKQHPAEPRFVDPAPIEILDSGIFPEYIYSNQVLVAGNRNNLLVIADSRFFSARNCEGGWGWWGGNLRLIHDFWQDYLSGMERSAANEN